MLTNLAAFIHIEQLDRKMCHKQRLKVVNSVHNFPQRTGLCEQAGISLCLAFCSHTPCQPALWTSSHWEATYTVRPSVEFAIPENWNCGKRGYQSAWIQYPYLSWCLNDSTLIHMQTITFNLWPWQFGMWFWVCTIFFTSQKVYYTSENLW